MELRKAQFCVVAHKEPETNKIFGKHLSRDGAREKERERERERTKRREGKPVKWLIIIISPGELGEIFEPFEMTHKFTKCSHHTLNIERMASQYFRQPNHIPKYKMTRLQFDPHMIRL